MPTADLVLATPDGPMTAFEAVPDGPARGAVVVVQEAFGVNAHIRDVTERFAAAGFHAVAPAYFHRAGGGAIGLGSGFAARVAQSGSAEISVVEGDIDVSPRGGSGEMRRVTAGAAIRIPGGPSTSHNNAAFSPCHRSANETRWCGPACSP